MSLALPFLSMTPHLMTTDGSVRVSRDSTRRIERVLDPSLLEKDAEAAKNLPIWAR